MTTYTTDIAILGGGIAGLFLFHGLSRRGYHCTLLDPSPLGNGQTVHSQGIIHGGMKYALNGVLNAEAEAIRGMPARWKTLVQGTDDFDLSKITVLSEHQWMWSSKGLGTKLATFFASKALRGAIYPIKPPSYPDFFQTPEFSGKVYEMADWVLDVPSLVNTLNAPFAGNSYQMHNGDSGQINKTDDGQIASITLQSNDGQAFDLKAQHYFFTSGQGNEQWLDQLQWPSVAAQRRPLHMVMLKAKQLPPLFAHGIGMSNKPTATITTHPHPDGSSVWYIGGNVAEQGLDRSEGQQIDAAQSQLHDLFPWFQVEQPTWGTLRIDRAEPKQSALTKPDAAVTHTQGNATIAWPTKLALAPNAYDQIMESGCLEAIQPTHDHAPLPLNPNTVARPTWEQL